MRKCTRPSPLYRTANDEKLDVGLGTRLCMCVTCIVPLIRTYNTSNRDLQGLFLFCQTISAVDVALVPGCSPLLNILWYGLGVPWSAFTSVTWLASGVSFRLALVETHMHHTHNIVNVNDLLFFCCQIMSQHGSHILILPDKIVNALACSTPKEFTRVLNPYFSALTFSRCALVE